MLLQMSGDKDPSEKIAQFFRNFSEWVNIPLPPSLFKLRCTLQDAFPSRTAPASTSVPRALGCAYALLSTRASPIRSRQECLFPARHPSYFNSLSPGASPPPSSNPMPPPVRSPPLAMTNRSITSSCPGQQKDHSRTLKKGWAPVALGILHPPTRGYQQL